MNRGDFSISGVNGWVEVTVAASEREDVDPEYDLQDTSSGNTLRGDMSVEMEGVALEEDWNLRR